MNVLSRRTFLRGSSVCLSLPWLEAMTPSCDDAPKRLIYVYAPNGIVPGGWMPTELEGLPEGQASPLGELPPLLGPLQAHTPSLQVLSGLTQDKARANGDGGGDHARASATFLTGVQALKTDGAVGLGISADQVAAAALGSNTRFRSIQLGTDGGQLSGQCDSGYACAYSSFISWQTATTPAGKESDPAQVFDRLFRGGLSPGNAAERMRIQARRRSLLDFVREDARDLRRLLGRADLDRLDEFESGLRELERRLVDFEELRVESVPDEARPSSAPGSPAERFKLLADVLILALRTDQTRVATLMVANEGSNRSYPDLGSTEGHHSLSHHQGDAAKVAVIGAINRHHVELFGHLLDGLAAAREGDARLLDASLVVYGSGLADGNTHSHHDLPILLAGGGNGSLHPGRHVVWPEETPLNNLHLALLERMGVRDVPLGDATGVLAGI
ncbi:MAG: DUF1552 domain-containing protein [Planctomycetota bacterium]|nr:DUF1552 domain-containing protein [Planctomycetota bacterium]MDP6937711.1 DUF1552 domain-containing protein [Planctomycetota bacterium]